MIDCLLFLDKMIGIELHWGREKEEYQVCGDFFYQL